MNYVCGFMMSYDLMQFLLIRKTHPEWQKGKLNGIGGKLEKKQQLTSTKEGDTDVWLYETPFEAMIREFYEETGIKTTRNRWRCFHIEEFDTGPDGNEKTKVYFFAAFGDEAKRQYIGENKDPMFEVVDSYSLLDLYFIEPEDTIYN